jgi:flagellar biosynthesis protein FlhG
VTVPDQASKLRQLVKARGPGCHAVAVVSGKGGVGKSNLAVNLALGLAERGVRAALVDLDMGLANADLLLNIQPRYTLAHVLSGVRTVEEVIETGPFGITFVAGASGLHGLANLSEFERQSLAAQLRKLDHSTDIVVFDCGAGLSRNVITFAQAADRILVVTTPEPTALTDAYAMIKSCRSSSHGQNVSLVVNMAHSRAEADRVYRRVSAVAKRFLNFPIANGGFILHDRVVELAVRERRPFLIGYPASSASACVGEIANELARICAVRQERGGFFRRLAGLFV